MKKKDPQIPQKSNSNLFTFSVLNRYLFKFKSYNPLLALYPEGVRATPPFGRGRRGTNRVIVHAGSEDGTDPMQLLLETIAKEMPKIETASNQAKITPLESESLINAVAKRFKLEPHKSLIAISIICQKGGTSKRAQGDIYAIVDGTRVTLQQIREVLASLGNSKTTLRQWARTNANAVQKVAAIYDIPGDLSKILQRKYNNNISGPDLIWCSNFQMDNENAPESVREMIHEHFQELFTKKS
jgi:hypothetical protein